MAEIKQSVLDIALDKAKERIADVPPVMFSNSQLEVMKLVGNAPRSTGEIEIIKEPMTRRLVFPDKVCKPEFNYRWISIDGADREIQMHGWNVVTKSNHSGVKKGLFDTTGAITFQGQNVLAFRPKQIGDEEKKKKAQMFSSREKELKDSSGNHYGKKGAVYMEAYEGDPGEGQQAQQLNEKE